MIKTLLHALDEQTDEAARLLVEFAKPALEYAVNEYAVNELAKLALENNVEG